MGSLGGPLKVFKDHEARSFAVEAPTVNGVILRTIDGLATSEKLSIAFKFDTSQAFFQSDKLQLENLNSELTVEMPKPVDVIIKARGGPIAK